MNKKRLFLRTAIISSVFALGLGLVVSQNVAPTKLEAEQHLENYDPYYYDGSYYNTIDFSGGDGLNGSLRTSLTTLIQPKEFYTYSKTGDNHLATQLQYADEDPNNSANMIYLYTRNSVKKNAASSWNREHVWCQSLSNDNWGTTKGGTDILHIRPVYPNTNSTRNNYPYGDTNKATPKYYENMLFGYLSGGYFEPIDTVKGDVARTIMYLWVTYNNNSKPLNITSVFKDYNTMLKWHTMDKPDVLEGNRNNYSQTSKQKNRNPFVDHPELAWRIFGDQVSASVKNECMEAYPLNGGGEQIDPTGIKLNKITASIEAGRTLQLNATLEPSGATGSVSWSSSNTSVATVSGGLVTAKTAGVATITATVASYSASCTITVTEAVNNYGTIDNPLSVDDAIEVISRTGNDETAEPLYVKGIATSSSYNSQYSNFSIWLQSDDGNTAQALQLYRAKLDEGMANNYSTSNALSGKELKVYGYGKIYNTTYELCTSSNSPTAPTILSITAPEATNIELDRISAEVIVGGTLTLHATLTPNNSESPVTWESSNTSVATVNSSGVVTGVGAGSCVITATVSDNIEAQCVITVTGGQQVTLELADSISGGDTVYLACGGTSNQYDGPSGSGASAIGTYTPYTTTPDANTHPLEVCEGSETDTYAFKIKTGTYANKYLGWSSGNSLMASDTLNSNTSWMVDIDGDNNATIANAHTSTRVIWWNVGSPRFCCYEGKSDGASFKYVQLWKASTSSSETPEQYLTSCASIATIHGNEGTSTQNRNATFAFGEQGYTNAQTFTSANIDSYVAISANKASGSNDPKFYTDSGLRLYGKNTLTITCNGTITGITITYKGGTYTGESITCSPGTLSSDGTTWTGSASSVTFTNTSNSQTRIPSVSVSYTAEVTTVDNVFLRFGSTISKENWDYINDTWGISDYGVMMAKQTTLASYGVNSIKQAFTNHEYLSDFHRGSNVMPHPEAETYKFTAKVTMTSVNNYGIVFCAAPYIVIDDEYYFLEEIRYSVNTLAQYYLTHSGSTLSTAALTVLSGN